MLKKQNVSIKIFEKLTDGTETNLYTITNVNGESVTLCDYGATVMSVIVRDKNSQLRDIVIGYEHISDYENGFDMCGATIGRVSGRISGGKFSIGKKEYQLEKNIGKHHIHGGMKGFAKRMWNAILTENGVVFTLKSCDGDEHYPGNLDARVGYSFDDNGVLQIEYDAISDKDTICNMTNHTYFNLNGHNQKSVRNHEIMILADQYLEIDKSCIPTGKMIDVSGTPFDFRKLRNAGKAFDAKNKGNILKKAYDHTFIKKDDGGYHACAICPDSGISMKCTTTQNGVHLYMPSGMYIPSTVGKYGKSQKGMCAFCFEMQNFPDAINRPEFPSPILKAKEQYHQVTKIEFSNKSI